MLDYFDLLFLVCYKLNLSFHWCFQFDNPGEVKIMIETIELLLIGTYTDLFFHFCLGIFQLYF